MPIWRHDIMMLECRVNEGGMKVPREYTVLVINTRQQQGRAASLLAQSLFRRLRRTSIANRLSVSIHTASSSCEGNAFSIVVESPGAIKKCFIKEFFFPAAQGPATVTYLLWIFRAPKRAIVYLWHKLQETRREAASARHNIIWTLGRLAKEAIIVFLEIVSFFCLIPLVTLLANRALRRMGTLAAAFYLFAVPFLLVLLLWKQSLAFFLAWVSRLAHELVTLTAGTGLTFEMLFPVLAGVVFATVLSVGTLLVRLATSVILKRSIAQEGNLPVSRDFSYLLDPLYAAEVMDNFERQLTDLNNTPNLQRILVVGQGIGALLAYEVLSSAYRRRISKPICLITCNLLVAEFHASPIRSLWLLVDPIDWGRFSLTTPKKLSWHHFTPWPTVKEYTFKLTSRHRNRLPKVEARANKPRWFQGTNAILVNHLITLLD